MGSIGFCNSWFCSLVAKGKDGRREASVTGSASSVVIPRSTWSDQRPLEMWAAPTHPTRKCNTWKDQRHQRTSCGVVIIYYLFTLVSSSQLSSNTSTTSTVCVVFITGVTKLLDAISGWLSALPKFLSSIRSGG